MPTDWELIAREAADATDKKLRNRISSLSRLSDTEIQEIIDSGISKKDLADVLAKIKEASQDNSTKADAIRNINNGVEVLVSILSKLI